MITTLLVDDEPRATDRLATLLAAHPAVDVIGTARDVGDAERFLAGRTPDVVFLDIDMPGGSGFDLVGKVRPPSRVVFVTAHDDRAIDAFHRGAVDYVLKPVDPDRLAITVERLREWFDAIRPAADAAASARPDDAAAATLVDTADAFTLADAAGVERVPLADIAWIEACRNYTRLEIRGRGERLVRRTMGEWESLLPAHSFQRISRSLIVQVAAIELLRWQSRDQTLVFFRGFQASLPLGRAATLRLKELLPR